MRRTAHRPSLPFAKRAHKCRKSIPAIPSSQIGFTGIAESRLQRLPARSCRRTYTRGKTIFATTSSASTSSSSARHRRQRDGLPSSASRRASRQCCQRQKFLRCQQSSSLARRAEPSANTQRVACVVAAAACRTRHARETTTRGSMRRAF